MTDYNDGNWHGWNGGECPVHPMSTVQYIWKSDAHWGEKTRIAGEDDEQVEPAWRTQIIAFRVIKQHREPRELWFRQGILSAEWHACRPEADGAALFREVLE